MGDLKQYLKINKFALDDGLEHQASLYQKVSDLYANAVAVRDALQAELELIDAEIDKEIRMKLGKECTEPKVKAMIIMDIRHKTAQEAYLEAKLEANKLKGLEVSLEKRGAALDTLAKLWLGGYFGSKTVQASPSTSEVVYRQRRTSRDD